MRHKTWADRIYAWMLVLYPRRFRRQYGLDMVEMFRDARIDRAGTGRSTFKLWVKTIRDLVLNAAIMRMAPFITLPTTWQSTGRGESGSPTPTVVSPTKSGKLTIARCCGWIQTLKQKAAGP